MLGPAIFGDGSTWPEPYERGPDPQLRQFGVDLWAIAQKLVDQDKLQHHPVRVLDGGLQTMIDGMELVKRKAVSGENIVIRLSWLNKKDMRRSSDEHEEHLLVTIKK